MLQHLTDLQTFRMLVADGFRAWILGMCFIFLSVLASTAVAVAVQALVRFCGNRRWAAAAIIAVLTVLFLAGEWLTRYLGGVAPSSAPSVLLVLAGCTLILSSLPYWPLKKLIG